MISFNHPSQKEGENGTQTAPIAPASPHFQARCQCVRRRRLTCEFRCALRPVGFCRQGRTQGDRQEPAKRRLFDFVDAVTAIDDGVIDDGETRHCDMGEWKRRRLVARPR